MAERYEEIVRGKWTEFQNRDLRPNIMLLGATGCGKSSLVNLVFGKEMARVSDTDRGTEGFEFFNGKQSGLGVNLMDSRGYELSDGTSESFARYERDIRAQMEQSAAQSPEGRIHIVWYCVSVAAKRLQEYDIQALKMLLADPRLRDRVAVVLTKCDEDNENATVASSFRKVLAEKLPAPMPVFEVSKLPSLPLDLDKLVVWSSSKLDSEDMREAFVASQVRDLDLKRETAGKAIYGYDAAAAAIGAIPLPLSDAILLAPLQVGMAAHVTHIYELDSIGTLSSAALADVLITNLGKSVAGGLLKLIPVAGPFIGGAVNGTVAVALTHAMGHAISTLCYESCQKMLRGEKVDVSALFDVNEIKKLVTRYMQSHPVKRS